MLMFGIQSCSGNAVKMRNHRKKNFLFTLGLLRKAEILKLDIPAGSVRPLVTTPGLQFLPDVLLGASRDHDA